MFTPHGAFVVEGDSARNAINGYLRAHPGHEVLGILRSDLIVKPPTREDGRPFICTFIQGHLIPAPNPEKHLAGNGGGR